MGPAAFYGAEINAKYRFTCLSLCETHAGTFSGFSPQRLGIVTSYLGHMMPVCGALCGSRAIQIVFAGAEGQSIYPAKTEKIVYFARELLNSWGECRNNYTSEAPDGGHHNPKLWAQPPFAERR